MNDCSGKPTIKNFCLALVITLIILIIIAIIMSLRMINERTVRQEEEEGQNIIVDRVAGRGNGCAGSNG